MQKFFKILSDLFGFVQTRLPGIWVVGGGGERGTLIMVLIQKNRFVVELVSS